MLSLLFSSAVVLACTTNSNNGGGGGGTVVVIPLGDFSNLPPTPNPTPPPPPPPVAYGWVPAPHRAPAQDKTRPNCNKRVDFFQDSATTSGGAKPDVQEEFEYRCEYQIYVEVTLYDTPEPVPCSCGFSYTRKLPEEEPDKFKTEHEVDISNFNLVIYHVLYKKPLAIIKEFDLDLDAQGAQELGATTREALKHALLGDTASTGTQAEDFDGFITANAQFFKNNVTLSVKNYPLLDPSVPENRDHVAAMCFTVSETYRTAYRWPEPPTPVLGASPNAFATNCVPFYPPWSGFDASEAGQLPNAATQAPGKRWHNVGTEGSADGKQVWWFREYLLFKNRDVSGVTTGVNPKHRYMTSYYIEANCANYAGVVTFDREFDSDLIRNPTMYGAFTWTRSYTRVSAVGGAPHKLMAGGAYQITGFHTVSWVEMASFVYDGAHEQKGSEFRAGLLANMLTGKELTDINAASLDNWQPGVSMHKYKLCSKVPAGWSTAIGSGAGAPYYDDRYLETALYYPVGTGADLDCTFASATGAEVTSLAAKGVTVANVPAKAGAFVYCASEKTFLAFQNDGTGALARDFSKKRGSWLLTGPRSEFCNAAGPSTEYLDALVFAPIEDDEVLKRAVVTSAGKRRPKLNYKRDSNVIDSVPSEPAWGHPEAADIIGKPAAGSNDKSGKPGGDHPYTLFPETYTVPVSLDPEDLEYSSAKDGWVFDGKFSPCLQGTQGCNCRDREGRPKCDAPLVCTSDVEGMQSAGAGFCVDPPCEAGMPGCDCLVKDDGSHACGNANLQCEEGSFSCTFKTTCAPGATGCVCVGGPGGSCTNAEDSCYEGFCLAFDCPTELPGCACGSAGTCFLQDQECVTDADTTDKVCGEPTTGGPFTTGKKLGGRCGSDTDCTGSPGSTCHATLGICVGGRCDAGTSGCRCNVGKCSSALDECTALGICLTQTCEPGAGGCSCYEGKACAAGFECNNPWDGVAATRSDRCIRERCEEGTSGCPCNKAASKPCVKQGFNCLNMLAVGSDYKCVALGHQCGNQIDRCIKFCGASNVLKCPGCSHQIPVCKRAGDSSVGTMSLAALLALLAVFVQLF